MPAAPITPSKTSATQDRIMTKPQGAFFLRSRLLRHSKMCALLLKKMVQEWLFREGWGSSAVSARGGVQTHAQSPIKVQDGTRDGTKGA